MFESHPSRGEFVQHRGLIRISAIRTDAFVAEIVRHDDHDIRLLGRLRVGESKWCEEDRQIKSGL
jgi:hypothetical protein